ncbi:MAG: HD domain-containing protein [Ornithinimicrobium sp.]
MSGQVDANSEGRCESAASLIDRAREVATEAHFGQFDKAGVAYITHPARVAERVRGDEAAEIVAWLHDVIEDTQITLADLADYFPPFIVEAVDAMSRRSTEEPELYYRRVRANAIARAVKLADIADNSDPERRAALDKATQERLDSKYQHALQCLGARLPALSPSSACSHWAIG